MFPSCVPPLNNISFKDLRAPPLSNLFPIIPSALLSPPPTTPHRQATQHNQDICVYKSFLYGSECGEMVCVCVGGQTQECSVNLAKLRGTVICFLSTFLQQKCALLEEANNNAPIQHVSALLLSRKEETSERSEKRSRSSTDQCPASSYKGYSLSELLGTIVMFLQAGNEEAHVSLQRRLRNLLSHGTEGAVCWTLTRKQEWWCFHW